MTKRKETKLVSPCGNYRYRIFKSYDGKSVVVVRHRRDYDAAQVIVDCIGDEEGRVFESQGEIIEDNPVHDVVMGSVKKSVEFISDFMNQYGRSY